MIIGLLNGVKTSLFKSAISSGSNGPICFTGRSIRCRTSSILCQSGTDTSNFLRKVAEALGLDKERVEKVIAEEEEEFWKYLIQFSEAYVFLLVNKEFDVISDSETMPLLSQSSSAMTWDCFRS